MNHSEMINKLENLSLCIEDSTKDLLNWGNDTLYIEQAIQKAHF